jgi:hypothetical protein
LERNRQSIPSLSLVLVWFLLFLVPSVSTGLNLPRVNEEVRISGEAHSTLKRYFAGEEGHRSGGLPPDVEKTLVAHLPPPIVKGCDDMVSHWGAVAEGTATLSARVLGAEKKDAAGNSRVFLAVRCYSSYREYREKYLDERISVLTVRKGESVLALVADGVDRKNDAELSRLGRVNAYAVEGGTLGAIEIDASNDNPCCDGPFAYRERRIGFILLRKDAVDYAGFLVREREEFDHDDEEGDQVTRYVADVTEERDRGGRFTGFRARYVSYVDGAEQEKGVVLYNWNPARKGFDEDRRVLYKKR